MLVSRSSSFASRASFSSAASVGRWVASASIARSSAPSISAGSAPLLPRIVAFRNWISAISAGSRAVAAARSRAAPASSQRSLRSCTRASDSSAPTLSGSTSRIFSSASAALSGESRSFSQTLAIATRSASSVGLRPALASTSACLPRTSTRSYQRSAARRMRSSSR